MIDERSVSTAVGYVLTLGITAILVSGLLIAGTGFVEDQREEVIETELEIVGEQVVTHINAADRLNQSGQAGETEVEIEQRFPADVVGQSYRINLEDGEDGPQLRLETTRPTITVTLPVTTTTAIDESSASGGTVLIEYDPDRDAVVIDSA